MLKLTERSTRGLKSTRYTHDFPGTPVYGIAYVISKWMYIEVLNGHVCKYHLNGRLVARSATYQGV